MLDGQSGAARGYMLQFTIIFVVEVKSHMAYRLCHLSILMPATDKMEDGIK